MRESQGWLMMFVLMAGMLTATHDWSLIWLLLACVFNCILWMIAEWRDDEKERVEKAREQRSRNS